MPTYYSDPAGTTVQSALVQLSKTIREWLDREAFYTKPTGKANNLYELNTTGVYYIPAPSGDKFTDRPSDFLEDGMLIVNADGDTQIQLLISYPNLIAYFRTKTIDENNFELKQWTKTASAEAIFQNDLQVTHPIGTITEQMIKDGGGVYLLEVKNLSYEEGIKKLTTQESVGKISLPKINKLIYGSNDFGSFEVGSIVEPKFQISFNKGSYPYGPSDTGVTIKEILVNGEKKGDSTEDLISLGSITIEDSTNISMPVKVKYNAATTAPKSNLGNIIESEKIVAGITKEVNTPKITGFRYAFFGGITNSNETINSDIIRSLSNKIENLQPSATFSFTIDKDTKKAIIAYPSSLPDIQGINDIGAITVDVSSNFSKEIIEVADSTKTNGYMDYKVYTATYDNRVGNSTLSVTLKGA